MKKLLAALLALLMLVTPALSETIVTSFYPIYVFALNLLDGVEGVTVANMTDSGAGCLHDYQLTSGDMNSTPSSTPPTIWTAPNGMRASSLPSALMNG